MLCDSVQSIVIEELAESRRHAQASGLETADADIPKDGLGGEEYRAAHPTARQ